MNTGKKPIVFSGHQPNFLPYMGFFYKMCKADIFVLDDDVQFSNKGLHNANYIRVGDRKYKMTIPVSYNFGDLINEVKISYEKNWDYKLLKTIKLNYGKTPHFKEGYQLLEESILSQYEYLADLNIALIKKIAENFKLKSTILIASKDVPTKFSNNERNIYQCMKVGGNLYYSGIGGKKYNNEDAYRKNGIKLVYSDYKSLEYDQKAPGFIKDLSVLDYIFYQGYSIPKEWIK